MTGRDLVIDAMVAAGVIGALLLGPIFSSAWDLAGSSGLPLSLLALGVAIGLAAAGRWSPVVSQRDGAAQIVSGGASLLIGAGFYMSDRVAQAAGSGAIDYPEVAGEVAIQAFHVLPMVAGVALLFVGAGLLLQLRSMQVRSADS